MARQRTLSSPRSGSMRLPPKMGPGAYKTYLVRSPADVHIVATCEAVGCEAWRNGWDTIVDESTVLGRGQADYIRSGGTGRSYREMRNEAQLTVFRFEAHQRCFADHHTRPEVFAVTDGDWRGNPRGTRARIHTKPEHWVEDFGLHQQRLADAHKEG